LQGPPGFCLRQCRPWCCLPCSLLFSVGFNLRKLGGFLLLAPRPSLAGFRPIFFWFSPNPAPRRSLTFGRIFPWTGPRRVWEPGPRLSQGGLVALVRLPGPTPISVEGRFSYEPPVSPGAPFDAHTMLKGFVFTLPFSQSPSSKPFQIKEVGSWGFWMFGVVRGDSHRHQRTGGTDG